MTVKTCSCGKTTVEFTNLKASDFPTPWILDCCKEVKPKVIAPAVVQPEAVEPAVKDSLTVETKPTPTFSAKKGKN